MKRVEPGWYFPDADEFMVGHLGKDGTYQKSHLDAALKHVTDWSCALDCGAHIGTWSKLMAEKFQQVIAFEPSPDTFEALQANLAQFGCANVQAMNVAVGRAPGLVSMHLDSRGRDLKNTGARFVRDGGDIELVTIDSLNLKSLGFLKMDIEGSEVEALEGASQTIQRCKPIILFENKNMWARFGRERQAPQLFLQRHRYREVEKVSMDVIWAPL
jgi:FkbM family methyltransferase